MKGIKVFQRFLKRNSSTILTCAGAVGVVGTTILAIKATPKAMRLLEAAEEEKGSELTKLEIVNVAGPVYIPSVATGLATIGCIFGANILNHKQQAALVSAYGLLDQCYKEYRDKVSDVFGEDAAAHVREEIVKEKYENAEISRPSSDKCLFYEEHYGRYFERSMLEVTDAEYRMNEMFAEDGVVSLNEFFDLLGLDEVNGSDLIGWESDSMIEFYGHAWIKFEHQLVTMDDGLECYIIDTPVKPYSIL